MADRLMFGTSANAALPQRSHVYLRSLVFGINTARRGKLLLLHFFCSFLCTFLLFRESEFESFVVLSAPVLVFLVYANRRPKIVTGLTPRVRPAFKPSDLTWYSDKNQNLSANFQPSNGRAHDERVALPAASPSLRKRTELREEANRH